MLFDFGGQIDVAAVLLEHGGVGVSEAALVRTGGHMQQIDAVFQLFGDFHAVSQGVAAVEELGTAHAEFNGEAGTHGGPDRFQYPRAKRQRFSREPPYSSVRLLK